MTLTEDTSVQEVIEYTLKHMDRKSLDKMDRTRRSFVLHVVPKEYQQRKFIPDESTSKCAGYNELELVSFPDPTAYVGILGTGKVFTTPAGMSAEPIGLLFVLLCNPLYDIRMHLIRTYLHSASVIYVVITANYIKEDCFTIEEVRTTISAAARMYVQSARMASKQLRNMPIIAFHCVPTSCPESPDPSSPCLLRKGLGTRLSLRIACGLLS